MVYNPIKAQFRQASPFVFNIDYFDYAAGAGYKTYYLAGSRASAVNSYFLTTDSSFVSDNLNYNTPIGVDLDFDLEFGNPVTIAAADATINFLGMVSGSDGDTFSCVVTIYHVDTSSTETSLGTTTITDSDGDPSRWFKKAGKIALTRKHFGVGEKLRVNLVLSGSGSTWRVYFDPAGSITQTGAPGGSINSRASVNIPFEVDL